MPASRKVTIYKTSSTTRLKVSVSDNFRTSLNTGGGHGSYSIRMNGSSIGCDASQYQWNAAGWSNNYFLPFANLCVTDVIPSGVYEFEAWAISSSSTAYVGWLTGGQALLLVEEFDPGAQYALSQAGEPFGTTSGTYVKAPGRELTYDKQSSSSVLRVTLADTFRVGLNQNGGSGSLVIRMDGTDTSCATSKYDAQGTGGDFHDPMVMTCILSEVSTGSHTFDVWIKSSTPPGNAYLGWTRSHPTLLVEELPADRVSYSNASAASGDISGSWAAVGARQLTHDVGAAGRTMKVTYSDTFRAVGGCNGRAGFFQLYVDNQATGCINGQYVHNGGATQDHHHPINHICVVSDLEPGNHTFAIWSTTIDGNNTSCGANHFGWNRGQNLLMVEELP
jgi:hypothetical protein